MSIVALILPSFGLAQGAQAPETMEEAKFFGIGILKALPGAAKDVWENEALPFFQNFFQKVWGWTEPKIKPLWQKAWDWLRPEVEKRKPLLEEEFQKEKEEMKEELPKVGKSLWERFRELLK